MWAILQVLVCGVSVNGGHQTVLDTECVIEDLGKRSQAVGGARGVRDDVVRSWVVQVVVDTHYEGSVFAGCWSRNQNLLGACLDVLLGVVSVGEAASRLDNDVYAQLAPAQVCWVALG